MNRPPFALRRIPPSPRAASVTSRPITPGGHTIPVWVELDELRVNELCACLVCERVSVAHAFPRVRREPLGPAAAARGKHDRRRRERRELARRAPVSDGTADAVAA